MKKPFIFYGIVEDNKDPLEAGRVRVRIYGFHSPSKSDIPTESLPWASVTVNSIENQTGISDVIPVNATVIVHFNDVEAMQDPIVIGVLSGNNDLHQNAKGTNLNPNVPLKTNLFSEPSSEYATEYSFNTVIANRGSFIEIDGTSGAERIQIYHKSGSFEEYHPNGDHVQKIRGEDFEIILDNKNLFVRGNLNVSVNGDANFEVAGDVDIASGGTLNLSASDSVVITGRQIHLNTGGSVDGDGTNVSGGAIDGGDGTDNDGGDDGASDDVIGGDNTGDNDNNNDDNINNNSGNSVFVQDTPPENAQENDIWFDTSNNNEGFVFVDGEFQSITSNAQISEAEILNGTNQTIISATEPNYFLDGPFANGDIWQHETTSERLVWNNITQTWTGTNSVSFGNAIIRAGLNAAISDELLVVFRSASIPFGGNEGDLWLREDSGDVYRLKNNRWINFNNDVLDQAFENLTSGLQNESVRLHFLTQEPSAAISAIGDIWIDGQNLLEYNGTDYVEYIDPLLNNSLDILAFDQNIVDGRIDILFSPSQPETGNDGDVWIDISVSPDTNEVRNEAYTFNEVTQTWDRVTDPSIEQAIVGTARFTEIQDGQIAVYFSEIIPNSDFSPAPKVGDIWFDISQESITDSNNFDVGNDVFSPNTPSTVSVPRFDQYRFNGENWVSIDNFRVSDVSARLDIETTIREEQNIAIAQQVTTFETSVDDNTTRIQETLNSIDGISSGYTLTLDQDGIVSGINLLSDFTHTITVDNPVNDVNYRIGEQIFIGNNLTTSTFSATVVSWNRNTKQLRVISENGNFTSGDNLIGDLSNAVWNSVSNVERTDFGSSLTFDVTNFSIVDTSTGDIVTPFTIQNGTVFVGGIDTTAPQITFIGNFSTSNEPDPANFNINSVYSNIDDGNSYIIQDNGNGNEWGLFIPKGNDGEDGIRGSSQFYATTTGTTWSNTIANNAISTVGFTNTLNDTVIISNATLGFSETRAWDGTTWIPVTQVIDGNLIVQGTIGADRIVASSTFTQSLFIGDTNLELDGGSNRITVTDGIVSRVIIGDTDGNGNFGIVIRDDQGNDIINQGGIQLSDTTTLNGNSLFSNLAEFFTETSNLRDAAGTSATLSAEYSNKSLTNARQLRPNTFENADDFFIEDFSGHPDTDRPVTGSPAHSLIEDPLEGFGIRSTAEQPISQRSALPAIVGNTYRITARGRVVTPPTGNVTYNIIFYGMHSDYSGVGSLTIVSLPVTADAETFTAEYVLTQARFDQGVRWLRAIILPNSLAGAGGGDGVYETFLLGIEDITSEANASISAEISTESAAIATTQAAAAQQSTVLLAQVNRSEILLRFDEEQTDWVFSENSLVEGDQNFTDGSKLHDVLPPDTTVEVVNGVPELIFDGQERGFYCRDTVAYSPTEIKFYRVSCQIKYDRENTNTTSRILLGAYYLEDDYSRASLTGGFPETLTAFFANGTEWTDIEWLFAASRDPVAGWQHMVDTETDFDTVSRIRFEGQGVYNNGNGKMRLRNFAVKEVTNNVSLVDGVYILSRTQLDNIRAQSIIDQNTIASISGHLEATNTLTTTAGGALSQIAQRSVDTGAITYSDITLTSDRLTYETDGGVIWFADAGGLTMNRPIRLVGGTDINNPDTMLVIGNGFGANNDLLEWFGPYAATFDGLTVENGVRAKDIVGKTYLGGVDENAGTITASDSHPTEAEVTGIGTNGNQQFITGSFVAAGERTYTQPTDAGNATITVGSATITVARRINNGAYTNIGTQNISGTLIRTSEFNFEENLWFVVETWNMSGSINNNSFTGNAGSTYSFRTRISNLILPNGIVLPNQNATISILEN